MWRDLACRRGMSLPSRHVHPDGKDARSSRCSVCYSVNQTTINQKQISLPAQFPFCLFNQALDMIFIIRHDKVLRQETRYLHCCAHIHGVLLLRQRVQLPGFFSWSILSISVNGYGEMNATPPSAGLPVSRSRPVHLMLRSFISLLLR